MRKSGLARLETARIHNERHRLRSPSLTSITTDYVDVQPRTSLNAFTAS